MTAARGLSDVLRRPHSRLTLTYTPARRGATFVRVSRIRLLVDALCSPSCAGRRSGTPEGDAARAIVKNSLRDAGLDPFEQPTPLWSLRSACDASGRLPEGRRRELAKVVGMIEAGLS